jgi:GT2 family glycosyltransferase
VTVAVAVPTYFRDSVLVSTLEQVLAQSLPPDEVIVVDQTPIHDPGVEEWLEARSREGRIVWLRQGAPSLPRARNRALAESQSDIVLFIDDDVRLSHDFVKAHAEVFADERVAAVAGRVLDARNRKAPCTTRTWPRVLDHRYFSLEGTERVEGIARLSGCNHSVRRTAMIKCGGYDENYDGWAHGEDADAALRLWKAGKLIVFEPRAELVHLAVPAGGCRIENGGKRLPEWAVSYCLHYLGVRHLFPRLEFWTDLLVVRVRQFVLRKENVLRPWRLPWALIGYCAGLTRAVVKARRPALMTWPTEEEESH